MILTMPNRAGGCALWGAVVTVVGTLQPEEISHRNRTACWSVSSLLSFISSSYHFKAFPQTRRWADRTELRGGVGHVTFFVTPVIYIGKRARISKLARRGHQSRSNKMLQIGSLGFFTHVEHETTTVCKCRVFPLCLSLSFALSLCLCLALTLTHLGWYSVTIIFSFFLCT